MSEARTRIPGLAGVDRDGPIPLHAQIDQVLRDLIRLPKYAEGEILPDEISLANALGVSRGTIRAGMAKLIQEGLIERRARVGTRVARRAFHTGIAEWHSLTREMAAQGIQVTNFEISVTQVPADPEVAVALRVPADTPVWRIRRVRGWQNERIILTISWVHPRLGLNGNEPFDQPLNELLQSVSGIVPERSHEELSACLADGEADALEIPSGSPLLVRKRTTFDAKGDPIEFNLNWYRVDRHKLVIDLHRK